MPPFALKTLVTNENFIDFQGLSNLFMTQGRLFILLKNCDCDHDLKQQIHQQYNKERSKQNPNNGYGRSRKVRP
jgi:hypothetical protein